MARRTLTGEMSPRELAGWVRDKVGYGLPEAEQLAYLDGTCKTLEYTDLSPADVDEQVLTEARRITR